MEDITEEDVVEALKRDHKQLLREKLDAAYKALDELNDIVTEEDMIWADKALWAALSSDELGTEEDEQLAMSLLNLEDNLRDMSHAFALRM